MIVVKSDPKANDVWVRTYPGNEWAGEVWAQQYSDGRLAQVVGISELVITPLGAFDDCVKIKIWWNGSTFVQYEHYCPSIGLVLYEYEGRSERYGRTWGELGLTSIENGTD
ncbi:TPA: hypothetical protein EYP38_05395 [Candidatus Micrarchaeota archaeon]|nr:hypothetical protein [Candidatus Micrarchaeota archaeon]